jgi:hypothetical protein
MRKVAVFGGHGTFHGRINIGIVKHNKRRISAQFHGESLHGTRTVPHQLFTHLGGAGEGQFTDNGVGGKLPANGGG